MYGRREGETHTQSRGETTLTHFHYRHEHIVERWKMNCHLPEGTNRVIAEDRRPIHGLSDSHFTMTDTPSHSLFLESVN